MRQDGKLPPAGDLAGPSSLRPRRRAAGLVRRSLVCGNGGFLSTPTPVGVPEGRIVGYNRCRGGVAELCRNPKECGYACRSWRRSPRFQAAISRAWRDNPEPVSRREDGGAVVPRLRFHLWLNQPGHPLPAGSRPVRGEQCPGSGHQLRYSTLA